jgi:ankyrin repeat protein
MWSGFVWTGFRFKAPTPGLQHVAMQVIGVDPNLGDYDNRTALHLAASNGHLETITRMLEFGYLDAWWQEAHKHTDTDTVTQMYLFQPVCNI